jgi:hypothetical protein
MELKGVKVLESDAHSLDSSRGRVSDSEGDRSNSDGPGPRISLSSSDERAIGFVRMLLSSCVSGRDDTLAESSAYSDAGGSVNESHERVIAGFADSSSSEADGSERNAGEGVFTGLGRRGAGFAGGADSSSSDADGSERNAGESSLAFAGVAE